MTATTAQIDRTARDWTGISGAPVRVEQIGSCIYGFTTELGALRLFRKFNGTGRADYSANLGSWFFAVEVK